MSRNAKLPPFDIDDKEIKKPAMLLVAQAYLKKFFFLKAISVIKVMVVRHIEMLIECVVISHANVEAVIIVPSTIRSVLFHSKIDFC